MVEDVSEIKWALNKYKFVVIRDINLNRGVRKFRLDVWAFHDDPYLEC